MTDDRNDPFFQYPRTDYATSDGPVGMPILYFDASVMMALFFTDPGKARSLLEKDGFEPVRFGNGKALVGVAFYEYRNTTIGDYNEVGVAVAAVPPGTPLPFSPLLSLMRHPDKNRVGLHIIDLPVTTSAACAAGRDIWGYPKFVTPIRFAVAGARFDGAVSDPETGGEILTLSGRVGPGVPAPLLDLVLYSRLDGRILRGTANTRGGGTLSLPGSLRLNVSDGGTHRMARNLRALGLADARPAFVSRSNTLQLRLNAGAVVG
ncbi:MAG: hypothetical protein F8N37_20850 [Telmatospirillum sp.]|nr:hypothetical protein [Telmatospirillum sp.]